MSRPDLSKPNTLESQVAKTLDKSIARLDEPTLGQLKAARERALANAATDSKHTFRIAPLPLGMGLAACLALVVFAPLYMQTDGSMDAPIHENTGINTPGETEIAADTVFAYLDEDPEFLMTMEMLEILGTPDDAS